MTPRLEIRGLSKTFGRIQVLHDVRLTVEPGEIHALVGQNGSGKSTVVKVLTGYHAPDRGASMSVDGHPVRLPVKPRELEAAGISVVHQDLGLVDHLSVAENIGVGRDLYSRWTRKLARREERTVAAKLLSSLGVVIDPTAPVGRLAAEERACVAIARALRSQPDGGGLIILDEATRALSKDAAVSFYGILRNAVRRGSGVLFVAHNLREVIEVADRITVLRDGSVVGEGVATRELSEQAIARLMLGRSLGTVSRPASGDLSGAPHVVVRGLRLSDAATFDAELRSGEIVGLTGRTGSGYEEIPYLVSGAMQAKSGELQVGEYTADLSLQNVRSLLNAKVVLVPERRDVHGLAFELRMWENISLPWLRGRSRLWFSGARWQLEAATSVIESLGVEPRMPSLPVGKLSGGNQQKVLFGKWLFGHPSFLVLHEPTQGVDVAARQDLLNTVVATAQAGTAVLLASSDFEDLSSVCHRVLVLRDGAVETQLDAPSADDIVASVYGAPSGPGHSWRELQVGR
jgi:ribose transport system ATP-binding protein